MRKTGIMKDYHVISTNANKISVDQVTTEDILTILKELINKYGGDEWIILIDDLYKHIIDFDNPHRFVIEQLDERVIEKVYSYWLLEGYKGDIDKFLNVFFQYVNISDINDLALINAYVASGENDKWMQDRVPTVALISAYIKQHNEDLNAHKEQLEKIFGKAEDYPKIENIPTFAISRISGVGLSAHWFSYLSGKNIVNCPIYRNSLYMGVLFQMYTGNKTNQDCISIASHLNPVGLVGTQPSTKFQFISIGTSAANKLKLSIGYINPSGLTASIFTHEILTTIRKYMNVYCSFESNTDTLIYYLENDKLKSVRITGAQLTSEISEQLYLNYTDIYGFEYANMNTPRCLGCFGYMERLPNNKIKSMLNINWNTPA